MRGMQKVLFVNFSSLVVLLLSVGERWWGGEESLIYGQLMSHLFPAGILAEAVSVTHSGMLYRLDICTFYFHKPLLFQIFVAWKFIKTSAFPCLLSLLQTTATSLNMLICFKYTV